QEDMDAEMDAILKRIGLHAPAVEEDFVDTVYLPMDGGQIVYNLYAPTDWTGDPAADSAAASSWFALHELENVEMDARVREGILVAFGLHDAKDESQTILAALSGQAPDALPPPPESPAGTEAATSVAPPGEGNDRREAGVDVLRTLAGGSGGSSQDAGAAAAGLRTRYQELADDVIDALGAFWAVPDLDRKTRSLVVVSMLAATGKFGPLRTHIAGALNHGAAPAEVIETMRMVAVYAGFPAALEAWPVMEEVFAARGVPRPQRPGDTP
ncbi:MAG: carboxymuconolactone decarboxylase family protein, partial [Tepidiformaceae bacterium]